MYNSRLLYHPNDKQAQGLQSPDHARGYLKSIKSDEDRRGRNKFREAISPARSVIFCCLISWRLFNFLLNPSHTEYSHIGISSIQIEMWSFSWNLTNIGTGWCKFQRLQNYHWAVARWLLLEVLILFYFKFIFLRTKTWTPVTGKTVTRGSFKGEYRKNSNSSLYHLTELSRDEPRSNKQCSSARFRTSTTTGTCMFVMRTPTATAKAFSVLNRLKAETYVE